MSKFPMRLANHLKSIIIASCVSWFNLASIYLLYTSIYLTRLKLEVFISLYLIVSKLLSYS
jgi:hypothetical protein